MSDVWESILVQGFQKCRGINVSHYDQWCTNDSVPNTVYRAPIKAPFTDSTLSNRRPDILLHIRLNLIHVNGSLTQSTRILIKSLRMQVENIKTKCLAMPI